MPTDNTAPKHLTPWRPGQSENPSGRPKGRVTRSTLAVEALLDDEADGKDALIRHRSGNPGFVLVRMAPRSRLSPAVGVATAWSHVK
jgi:hypothetical protein